MKPSLLTQALLDIPRLLARMRARYARRRAGYRSYYHTYSYARESYRDNIETWYQLTWERKQIDSGAGVTLWRAIEYFWIEDRPMDARGLPINPPRKPLTR